MPPTLQPLETLIDEKLDIPLVSAFSKMRPNIFHTEDPRHTEELVEFNWFADQYPSVYAYYKRCAFHRAISIQTAYQDAHAAMVDRISGLKDRPDSVDSLSTKALQTYWDFDACLVAVSTALDVLTRVAGTAYEGDKSPTFGKFCKKNKDTLGVAKYIVNAKTSWVDRFKTYRDCLVHFTCSTQYHSFTAELQSVDEYKLRCVLPDNPNQREMLRFTHSNGEDVYVFAANCLNNLHELESKVAEKLLEDYQNEEYPKQTKRLFTLGKRKK